VGKGMASFIFATIVVVLCYFFKHMAAVWVALAFLFFAVGHLQNQIEDVKSDITECLNLMKEISENQLKNTDKINKNRHDVSFLGKFLSDMIEENLEDEEDDDNCN